MRGAFPRYNMGSLRLSWLDDNVPYNKLGRILYTGIFHFFHKSDNLPYEASSCFGYQVVSNRPHRWLDLIISF
jgi:hypothetical protein